LQQSKRPARRSFGSHTAGRASRTFLPLGLGPARRRQSMGMFLLRLSSGCRLTSFDSQRRLLIYIPNRFRRRQSLPELRPWDSAITVAHVPERTDRRELAGQSAQLRRSHGPKVHQLGRDASRGPTHAGTERFRLDERLGSRDPRLCRGQPHGTGGTVQPTASGLLIAMPSNRHEAAWSRLCLYLQQQACEMGLTRVARWG